MVHDQQYAQMLLAARARLARHTPQEIAERAGVSLEDGLFRIQSLGRSYTVHMEELPVMPEPGMWLTLLMLHYLDLADGTPPSGQLMPFSGYPDGLIRGGGFDRDAKTAIRTKLGRMPMEVLKERCAALGAVLEQSNADLCARFAFFPHVPVWLKIWLADEDFPASGRLLLDTSAPHYLSIEDAVTAGTLLLERLCDRED